MKALRRALCVLALAVSLFAPTALATSFGTDQSDLWYIVAESGWGMQLVQRGNVIFATLFVYGQNSTPTWCTHAPMARVDIRCIRNDTDRQRVHRQD